MEYFLGMILHLLLYKWPAHLSVTWLSPGIGWVGVNVSRDLFKGLCVSMWLKRALCLSLKVLIITVADNILKFFREHKA